MNFDKFEKQNLLAHFSGELRKGYPRQVFDEKLIAELRADKVAVSQAWVIRIEVPVDMSIDCDHAMSWIQARVFNFVEAGFWHIGTQAAIQQTKVNGVPASEPFWFIHVIHPEYKDPRDVVKNCVHYQHVH